MNFKDLPLLLAKSGPSAMLLAFLLWWLTATVSADLKGLNDNVRQVQREHLEMRFYLRGICLNAADEDPKKVANCLYADEHR